MPTSNWISYQNNHILALYIFAYWYLIGTITEKAADTDITTFAHAPFSWAARHTTLCLDIYNMTGNLNRRNIN